MEIKYIKKTKYGYNVYSEDLKINIEESVFFKYKLKKGINIKTEIWQNILKENKLEFIKRKALLYLTRQRSTKEFITYLYKLEASNNTVKNLTEEFTTKGYLDDYLYAQSLIKKEQRRYGKNRIKEILINKGIKNEIITELLLEHVDNNLENQIVAACKTVKASNYNEATNKLLRSFIRKGYKLKEIKIYISKHLDKNKFNENEEIKQHYQRALKRYENKYKDSELNLKIRQNLYRKGFKKELIDEIIRGE